MSSSESSDADWLRRILDLESASKHPDSILDRVRPYWEEIKRRFPTPPDAAPEAELPERDRARSQQAIARLVIEFAVASLQLEKWRSELGPKRPSDYATSLDPSSGKLWQTLNASIGTYCAIDIRERTRLLERDLAMIWPPGDSYAASVSDRYGLGAVRPDRERLERLVRRAIELAELREFAAGKQWVVEPTRPGRAEDFLLGLTRQSGVHADRRREVDHDALTDRTTPEPRGGMDESRGRTTRHRGIRRAPLRTDVLPRFEVLSPEHQWGRYDFVTRDAVRACVAVIEAICDDGSKLAQELPGDADQIQAQLDDLFPWFATPETCVLDNPGTIEAAREFVDDENMWCLVQTGFFQPTVWWGNMSSLAPVLANDRLPAVVQRRVADAYQSFIVGSYLGAVVTCRAILEYALIDAGKRVGLQVYNDANHRRSGKPKELGELIRELEGHPLWAELGGSVKKIQAYGNLVAHPDAERDLQISRGMALETLKAMADVLGVLYRGAVTP